MNKFIIKREVINLVYLVKQVKRAGEDAKVRLRHVRREYNDIFKNGEKDGDISEDENRRLQGLVQDATDRHVAALVKMVEEKEAEVLEVCNSLLAELKDVRWGEERLRVSLDTRDLRSAEKNWDHIKKGVPDDIPEVRVPMSEETTVLDVIADAKLVQSKGEGRRLIGQSAVSIDEVKIDDPLLPLPNNEELVIKVGKRRFLRVIRS